MTTTTLTDYGQVYAEAREQEFDPPERKYMHHPRIQGEFVALCGFVGWRLCTSTEIRELPICPMCELLAQGPPA